MLPDTLKRHPFPVAVWKEAAPLQAEIEKKQKNADPKHMDEYQFYIIRVGHSLAQLMTWMEQIDHAVYYISDHSYSKAAKSEGISRVDHLLYNVENYLVRLQSIYDRSLQLTNNVFNLCIEESNVSHSVIVSNLRVSRTRVASLLKSLRRGLKPKAQARHEIVHRGSYHDPKIHTLELLYMFDKETWESNPGPYEFGVVSHHRSQLLREMVAQKKREFGELNEVILKGVESLLSGLHEQYDQERSRLRLYVYGTN